MSGMETGPGTNPYIIKPSNAAVQRYNRKSSLLLMEEIWLASLKHTALTKIWDRSSMSMANCRAPFLPSTVRSEASIHAFEQTVVDLGTSTWSPLASSHWSEGDTWPTWRWMRLFKEIGIKWGQNIRNLHSSSKHHRNRRVPYQCHRVQKRNKAFLGDCLGIMMVDNPLIMKTNLYILRSLPKNWFTVDSSKVRCPFTNDEQMIFPLCTTVLVEPNLYHKICVCMPP